MSLKPPELYRPDLNRVAFDCILFISADGAKVPGVEKEVNAWLAAHAHMVHSNVTPQFDEQGRCWLWLYARDIIWEVEQTALTRKRARAEDATLTPEEREAKEAAARAQAMMMMGGPPGIMPAFGPPPGPRLQR